VPTLDGERELEIEPGTQPGEVVVLRDKGMPVLQGRGRGDQRVVLDVVVPRRLTDEQRDVLRRFEESAGPETYEGGGTGFFDRLRATFR